MISPKNFSKKLLDWSKVNPRNYPWTGEKDPYKIWISEIILQQTRSEQGKFYYERFITRYPDINRLFKATEDEILTCWQGLGYYSRARNLHAAVKTIATKFNGVFPESFVDIKSLHGIGEYSAAAISSFAFNTPIAVVDGNVIRVLSRLLGIETSFYNSEGKRTFLKIANNFLDRNNPAAYNQAIMNFGAIQCKPQQPLCKSCIFLRQCHAYQTNSIELFPIKPKKNVLKQRYFHYFFLANKHGEIALRKRSKKDIWLNLYELPLLETKKNFPFSNITQLAEQSDLFSFDKNSKLFDAGKINQKLSHQEINGRFYYLKSSRIKFKIKPEFYYVKPENLVNFALPKILSVFLENFNPKKVC